MMSENWFKIGNKFGPSVPFFYACKQTTDWWESGGKCTDPIFPPPPPLYRNLIHLVTCCFVFSGVVINFGRCSAENGAELEKKKGER